MGPVYPQCLGVLDDAGKPIRFRLTFSRCCAYHASQIPHTHLTTQGKSLTFVKSIEKRLEELRVARRMTWKDLAALLGIGEVMVHYIRKGRRNPSMKLMSRIEDEEINAGLREPPVKPELAPPVRYQNVDVDTLRLLVREAMKPEVQDEVAQSMTAIEVELRVMKNKDSAARTRHVNKAIQVIHDFDATCEREFESLRHSHARVVESARQHHPHK